MTTYFDDPLPGEKKVLKISDIMKLKPDIFGVITIKSGGKKYRYKKSIFVKFLKKLDNPEIDVSNFLPKKNNK